ncbi:flocculation protein FLO11 [Biomphalaria glabrata]
MSAVNDVFSVEGPESYNQQNGDDPPTVNKNRATLEKIKSVHENPFFIQLGIKHSTPAHNRSSVKSESSVNEHEKKLDEEDENEITYRPGSGFVHRLLDKYKSLTSKGDTARQLKRASSLDELAAENDVSSTSKSVSFKEPSINGGPVFVEKPSNLSMSRLSKAHKARSVDGLHEAHHKQQPPYGQNVSSSRRLSGSKWGKDRNSTSLKCEAPDVELAREDIIIIEKTPPIPTHKESVGFEGEEGSSQHLHHHEELPANELPKPNTVLTVRTIFESVSTSNTNELLSRRRKTDFGIISPLSTTSPNTNSNSDLGQFSPTQSHAEKVTIPSLSPVTSPRVLHTETYAKPVLLPHSVVTSSLDHSKHSVESPVPSTGQNSFNNSSSSFNNHEAENEVKPSIIERSNYFRPSKTNRPTPTPRNTASVKPTIVQKPSAPVKPIPLSAPASAATSYKKSSPVVPVAPYKDKQDDIKDDGQPVMIFNKSKLSPRREKPQRVKTYEPVGEGQTDLVKEKNEKVNFDDTKTIIQNDEKVINNKVFSQSKIFKTPEDHNLSKTVLEKEDPVSQTSVKLIQSTKQRTAPKPPDSQKVHGSISININKTEERESNKSQVTHNVSHSSAHAATAKEIVSSSHEKPTSPVSQPVKGIPSIIAQRLKKQSSDPSQVAADVISSLDAIDGNRKTKLAFDDSGIDNDSPSPRKRVPPSSVVLISVESTNKDKISSEIENEIAAVRKKMEGGRSKSSNVSQIFDSSQLSKKRKENQRQKASQGLVPRLDLSGIDAEPDYQPLHMEIKPCNIRFIGENTRTERSLLVKRRTIKINIQFNDSKIETFEYPSEEWALEKYLEEHPNETADVIFLEDMNGESAESSDDGPETPRGFGNDDGLKSNTSLSSSGNLQSYKGRFQEDFQFGSAIKEKEPEPVIKPEEPPVDPDALMLRPAEEVDTSTWSTNDSSDLLF